MSARHTPGPWEISALTPLVVVQPLDPEHVRTLAVVTIANGDLLRSPTGEAAQADARLIAAAPALVEFVEDLRPILDVLIEDREALIGENCEIARDLRDRCRRLLAQALGQ